MKTRRQKRFLGGPGGALIGLLFVLLAATPVLADDAEIEFWRSVKESTYPDELRAYLEAYPNGKFAPLARIRLNALEASEDGEEQEAEASAPTPDEEPRSDAAADQAESPPPDQAADDTPVEPDEEQLSSDSDAIEKKDVEITLGIHPNDATKGLLGVQVLQTVPGFAEAFELDIPSAALITSVAKDGPSDRGGLQPGHLIVAVEGTATPDGSALVDAVGKHPPGASVTLKIIELAPTKDEIVELLDRKAETEPAVAYALANILVDDPRALSLVRKAAEENYAPALFDLGAKYYDGLAVPQDRAEAARWYRKAAEKDDMRAAYRLGTMYANGDGVAKDGAAAVRWKRKAAELGHTTAMFDVGVAYGNGEGVTKDLHEAMEWFRKAADLGLADAMSNIGYMYENGLGVKRDYGEAADWYRKAVARGHPTGHNNLGLLYDKGRGVPKDADRAAELLLKAYRVGENFAKRNLEDKHAILEAETRRALQRKLKEEGVYTGKIDGRFGSGTKRALKAYASQQQTRPAEAATSSDEPTADDFNLGDIGTLD